MLIHAHEQAVRIDVDGVDSRLLIEAVQEEANPGGFPVFGTAYGRFERGRLGIHSCATLLVLELGVKDLCNRQR